MKTYIYGDVALHIVGECRQVIRSQGAELASSLNEAGVAIAPLLQTKLSNRELQTPKHGTLIFHPSLLPRHRGRDAIKWAYQSGETYTGATWFWADDGLDTGDICEQEVLAIRPGESPRQFYERAVIPSATRMLEYIIHDLQHGIIRRRPQQHEHASYESPIRKRA